MVRGGRKSKAKRNLEPRRETSRPTRHGTYYFDEPARIFQFGDKLYKVPVSLLRLHSVYFNMMFDVPQGKGNIEEGLDDSKPIKILGETAETFDDVLAWLYRRPFTVQEIPVSRTSREMLSERWINLLRFAHKFEMTTLHEAAQEALTPLKLGDIQKLTLYELYDTPLTWALDAFRNLSTRKAQLSDAEIVRLDKDTSSILLYLRLKCRNWDTLYLNRDCVHGWRAQGCCFKDCRIMTAEKFADDEKLKKWIEEARPRKNNPVKSVT